MAHTATRLSQGILNRSGVTTDYNTFVLRMQRSPARETTAGGDFGKKLLAHKRPVRQ